MEANSGRQSFFDSTTISVGGSCVGSHLSRSSCHSYWGYYITFMTLYFFYSPEWAIPLYLGLDCVSSAKDIIQLEALKIAPHFGKFRIHGKTRSKRSIEGRKRIWTFGKRWDPDFIRAWNIYCAYMCPRRYCVIYIIPNRVRLFVFKTWQNYRLWVKFEMDSALWYILV